MCYEYDGYIGEILWMRVAIKAMKMSEPSEGKRSKECAMENRKRGLLFKKKKKDRNCYWKGRKYIIKHQRSRSTVTRWAGAMVPLWAALLAGAKGQAVFYGRELLAELPLFAVGFGKTRSVEGTPKGLKVSFRRRVLEITGIFYKCYPSIR